MKAIEDKERDLIFQHKVFLVGYGMFPYIILKHDLQFIYKSQLILIL
jgi:hypothetical protein